MKQYHKILTRADKDKRIGNHQVEHQGCSRYFFYHGNEVCYVNDEDYTYELFTCGYGNKISTKNCLAGYREYFNYLGYTQVNPFPIYKNEEK